MDVQANKIKEFNLTTLSAKSRCQFPLLTNKKRLFCDHRRACSPRIALAVVLWEGAESNSGYYFIIGALNSHSFGVSLTHFKTISLLNQSIISMESHSFLTQILIHTFT